MIESLYIHNLVLIDEVTIEFGAGLNVISGETGAGKSILIDALDLLLGGRFSPDLIRTGESESEVQAIFRSGEEEVSFRRHFTRQGKNRAWINQRPVPVSELASEVVRYLDIAGQHASQILFQPGQYRDLVDQTGLYTSSLNEYQKVFSEYKSLRQKQSDLVLQEKQLREKEDFLRFQWDELEKADLKEGEEEGLLKEKEVQKQSHRINSVVGKIQGLLSDSDYAIVPQLEKLSREFESFASLGDLFAQGETLLKETLLPARELLRWSQSLEDKAGVDPNRIEVIESRLALLHRLQKKHLATLPELIRKQDDIRAQLSALENFSSDLDEVESRLKKVSGELLARAKKLTQDRQKASEDISKKIESEIKSLGLKQARFELRTAPLSTGDKVAETYLDKQGAEDVVFYFCPNPGEVEQPLHRIASGGEISRVFLALKKVLWEVGPETVVFDEVDTGLGGLAADILGRKLSEYGRKKQVVCVTHLPQVACYADHHLMIQKSVKAKRTKTDVVSLNLKQREEEIARMIAGAQLTDKAFAHAKEMIQMAKTAQ